MSKTLRTMVTLALAALVLPVPATAFHDDGLPVIYTASGSGSASYAIRYDHVGGDFAIDLYGSGPASAQSISAAAFVFDANRNLVFGFAFTGHTSPDRLILSPVGEAGNPSLLPEWLDLTVETGDASADAACTFACVGISGPGAPAGTYYYLLWLSGVSGNAFEIRANSPGAVSVNAGAAYSIGDAEIHGGDLNVQVQEQGMGVKAMSNAGTTVAVNDRLWGFWGNSDFKLACQFVVGACVWRSAVTYTCYDLGANCDTTQVSHSGPSGSGTGFAAFLGTAAGDYTFTVDHKVDAYGPNVYDPATGTWLLLAEDYTYLTAADNELP